MFSIDDAAYLRLIRLEKAEKRPIVGPGPRPNRYRNQPPARRLILSCIDVFVTPQAGAFASAIKGKSGRHVQALVFSSWPIVEPVHSFESLQIACTHTHSFVNLFAMTKSLALFCLIASATARVALRDVNL